MKQILIITPIIIITELCSFIVSTQYLFQILYKFENLNVLFIGIIGYILLLTIFKIINSYLNIDLKILSKKIRDFFQIQLGKVLTNCEFSKIENPSFLERVQMAKYSTCSSVYGFEPLFLSIKELFSSLVIALYCFFIMNQLSHLFIFVVIVYVLIKVKKNQISNTNYENYSYSLMDAVREENYLDQLAREKKDNREIKVNNAINYFSNRYLSNNEKMKQISNKFCKEIYMKIFIYNFAEKLVLLFVLMLFLDQIDDIAEFGLYVTLFFALIREVETTINALSGIEVHIYYINLYFKLLDEVEVSTSEEEKTTDVSFKSLELVNVSFGYNKNKVLENINYKVEEPKIIGIVGENGSGKTTLIKLISNLYHPQEGEIRVNGKSLIDYSCDTYFSNVAVLFQKPCIFPMTLKENILGVETFENLKYAETLERAKVDFIEKLPLGENTIPITGLYKNGIELSGGQNQKISLGRALYKNASILIFDEPTSSMDPKSEIEFFNQIEKIAKEKLVIFITHRIAATKHCDDILVIQNKTVVEHGTFEELVKRNGYFKELYDMQKIYYEK